MTYQVIKYVKGIPYAYKQRCFRVGGKVKTESIYIGPVQGADPPRKKSETNPQHPATPRIPDIQVDTSGQTADMGQSVPQRQNDPESAPSDRKDLSQSRPELSLHITANLPSLKISPTAIEAEQLLHMTRLREAGIDPTSLPAIYIKHGKEVAHRKKAFRDAYVVTIPKRKTGNRQKLRTEYRKALGRATLDLIECTLPKAFDDLSYAFDDSYRATQDALNRYLLNTDDPHKWIKAFALKAFGYMNPVGHLSPAELGLLTYGQQTNWKEEFASLFSEVQNKGFNAVWAAYEFELNSAQHAEAAAIQDRSSWIFQRRRAIKRARARIEANEQILRKLGLMRWILSP